MPWGRQSLAGPPSGGQAQDWMVDGGEGISGPWEEGWTAQGPGPEGPQGLGCHGPWVVKLNEDEDH